MVKFPLALLLVATAVAGDLDDFLWRNKCSDPAQWLAQPSWVSNGSKTASVALDGESLRFTVDEPRQGMKWSASTPVISLADTPWLAVRYRAEHLNAKSGDYLVYLDDGVHGRQLNAVRLSDAKPDGKWHVAAVDVTALTKAAGVRSLALQVQADAEGKARLWVDWIAFLPDPPQGADVLRRAPVDPPKPDWIAPLATAAWTPHTGWLSNPASAGKHSVARTGDTWTLRVAEPSRGMKWSWNLPKPVSLAGRRYVALRYRATGVAPRGDYALCVIGKPRGDGLDYTAVLAPTDLIADGRWHTTTADLRPAAAGFESIGALALQVQAAAPDATLEIADIRFANAVPPSKLADFVDWQPRKRLGEKDSRSLFRESFSAVPLAERATSDVRPWLRKLRIGDWFTQEAVTAEGIGFLLQPIGPIGRIGPIPAGEEPGKHLAATGVRQKAELRIPADVRASEVYLLMLAVFIGPDEPCYGGGRLRVIRDVDRFRLRLEYADGTVDECLPMNVATKRFAIAPGPQVLVAAADPARRLKTLTLVDRCSQAAFALAAITARTSGKPGFPEAREDMAPLRGAGVAPVAGNAQTPIAAALLAKGRPTIDKLASFGWDLLDAPCPVLELWVDGKQVPLSAFRHVGTANFAEFTMLTYDIAGVDSVKVMLSVGVVDDGIHLATTVFNDRKAPLVVSLVAPRLGPYRLCDRAEDAWYLVPRRGAAFDNRPCSFRERHCGLFPVQFLDTFSPKHGRGLSLRTEDKACERKIYRLDKQGNAFTIGVEYPERTVKPGGRFDTPSTILSSNNGSWGIAFAEYRDWVRSWHQPVSPRKEWFREIFNFRQRFLHTHDPLYDAKTGTFQLQRAVEEARREFGGIDYLHVFDWGNCGKWGRVYGRTGDYSPYDFLTGGRDAFREAIAGVQKQGVPVGLYIEGYLLTARGKLGQAHGEAWQSIRRDGKGAWWPGNVEMSICAGVKEWREVQASTYETKVKELGVDGMYIDQFGFANAGKDCYSDKHGHPVPSYCVRTEREATKLIRERVEAARKGVAIYTEETPVDVTTPYQDGSFTYAMFSAQRTQTLVPLNIARFAFPDFKTIEILFCDKPTGSWATGVRWVFFNGEALWLEGPAATWFEPETRAEIRRCYRILRKHKDAFTSLEPVPLVPTEMGGVWANEFPVRRAGTPDAGASPPSVPTLEHRDERGGAKKTPDVFSKVVYTLYNARHRTVRGPVLRLPHREGARYYDEWHQRPAILRRDGDSVLLATELGPHGVGCLVMHEPKEGK